MLAISGFDIFFFLVAALIVIASMASNALKKVNEQRERAAKGDKKAQSMLEAINQLSESLKTPAPRLSALLRGQTEVQPPPIPRMSPKAANARRKGNKRSAQTAPPPSRTLPAPAPAMAPPDSPAHVPAAGRSPVSLTAANLRQQYILMELFAPPVALRENPTP